MSSASSFDISASLDAAYAHLAAGRLAESEALCRQILKINPREHEAMHCLASIAFHAGHFTPAVELLRNAIALGAPNAVYLNDLGTMLSAQGNNLEAISCYRQSLAVDTSRADVHYNLANALRTQQDLPGAATEYASAIRLQDDFVDAHFHLGNVLAEQGNLDAATEAFLAAIALQPEHAGAHYNLANAFADQGRLDEAAAEYRRVIELNPGFHAAHSNLLWTLQYMDTVTQQEAFAEARRFAEMHEAPLRARWPRHENMRDPQKRLKVGYVSPDFRRHSVAYFAESLIEHHDRSQFEVFCYYNNGFSDDVTQRFIALADHWLDCSKMDDASLAERIRADGIDILVDLAGHTAHHRLLTFARKPAPVQVTYLGYPATTGLAAIDYRFTDVHADPTGAGDAFYTEQLVRLPEAFLAYRPPDTPIEIQPTPALRNGFVTFGSFNALPKITPSVIALWSRLLLALPTSRLLLKAGGFENAGTRERFAAQFSRHGVALNRIDMIGKDSSFDAHLARYHSVDIGLDPFPYNGTTTTFEAMWMGGVPTISLCGDRHSTRVGASLLSNVDLDQFIARSEDEYAKVATAMADDIAQLDTIRRSMRDRLHRSPLLDADKLARAMEAAYRQMWRGEKMARA